MFQTKILIEFQSNGNLITIKIIKLILIETLQI